MKKFNIAQLQQLVHLEIDTNKEFMEMMKTHVNLLDSNELDTLLDIVIQDIDNDEFLTYEFDNNFHSVVSEYVHVNLDEVNMHFGYYGQGDLYMDDLGRGLIITAS